MRNLTFYKEKDGRWYVNLPEWDGTKSDLEMVSGADAMLEIISKGKNNISLMMSTKPVNGSDILFLMHTEDTGGAYYFMPEYGGKKYKTKMWLCDVTKFVFGNFPNKIYIKRNYGLIDKIDSFLKKLFFGLL